MRLRRTWLVAVVSVFALVASAWGAYAVQTYHDRVVSDDPANFTPHVLDGHVKSIVQVGEKMIVGGEFSEVREADSDTVLTRRNVFAFDAATGEVDTAFAPNVEDEVEVVLPAADGESVYIGGAFGKVNGAWHRRLAKLDLQDGEPVSGFSPWVNARVKDLRLSGGRLYVAGLFGQVEGETRRALVAVDPDTGQRDPFLDLDFAGTHSGGRTKVLKMDISPDGSRLVAVGNFTSVGGLARRQIVVLDLTGAQAQVADWYTPRYEAACSSSFDTYMRDVDFAPNGRYFVVTTTGAYRSPPRLCDTHARWETGASGTDVQPTWVNYTGGDTSYAVAVTGTAVYVGGHFRWGNNPFAADRPGPGAVPRDGIAALDPVNGRPLSWNPGRTRGVGVFDMLATPQGLWVGSDTDRIGNWEYHGRLALMPLAGGTEIPEPFAGALPGDVHLAAPEQPSNDELRKRPYDGETVGEDSPVPGNIAWSDARGTVMLNGTVYSAWEDGALYARDFDGETFGSPTELELYGLDAFSGEMRNMTGLFYDRGRLYFTLAGSSNLYYRYFTPESGVVGAMRFTASDGLPGVNFAAVRGMFRSGDSLYFADGPSGDLRRVDFDGAPVAGTAERVSGPDVDGTDWRSRDMFLYAGSEAEPPNEPPSAALAADCAGLACSFSGSGSTDSDGTIVSYDWDFGDGSTGDGVEASHTYAGNGTYPVTLTVTDDRGGTDTASREVSPEAAPISFVGGDVSNGNWSVRSVTVPPDVDGGDGLLLFLTSNRTDVTISDPAGVGGWTEVGARDTGSAVTRVWRKAADASDTGQRVSVNLSEVAKADLLVLAYDGTDTEDPVAAAEAVVEDTRRAEHTTPGVSVPASGSWVVSYWGQKSSSTTSWTAPGGEAQRSASCGPGGGRICTLATDSGGAVPAGTRDGLTATADSASRHATTWSIALAPQGA